MNTLDDLRATLAGHADDPVGALDPRVTAVHARIARVRRQRRAALAGSLAAVVLIAAGVVTGLALPSRHTSSPTPIAGHVLAPTVQVNGMTYDLGTTAESTPGQTTLTVKLPESDRDRAVSLVASGLGTGTATLYAGGTPGHIGADRQSLYDAGTALDRIVADSAADEPVGIVTEATRLTVRLRNTPPSAVVGLAVYDQGTALPPGVSADGMVFPQTVGDSRLVAATIGRVGQDSVSITFTGPLRNPDLESLCATGEKHIIGEIRDTASKGWFGSGCGQPDPTDDINLGVNHSEGVPSAGYGPGRHTITLRVFRGTFKHGTPVDLDDVHLALGLYDDQSPVRHVAGMDWDVRMLEDGRMWQLDRVVPATRRMVVDATSGPVMLGESYRGGTSSCLTAKGQDGTRVAGTCMGGGAGPSGSFSDLLMPGTSYTITTRDPDERGKAGRGLADLLIYRPAS